MSKERDSFVSAKMAKMTLAEKCGQVLTFTWRGAYLTPSGIEQITKLHAGGLCLEPYALETCKNLYWGRSQVDPNFKKPKDYFDIAHTYFDDHNFGVSVTPGGAHRRAQQAAEDRHEPARPASPCTSPSTWKAISRTTTPPATSSSSRRPWA